MFPIKSIILASGIWLLASVSQAFEPAVVSAHPAATEAGMQILKQGGSAADAAIATAFALTVVEPHNSGIGGGGFLLYYEAKKGRFSFVDYREVAPLRADPKFYEKDPRYLRRGIRSVAVPGFLKGMETVHERWKKLSWPEVVAPSIGLARKGVPIQGKLWDRINKALPYLQFDPESNRLFAEPFKTQGWLNQADLAKTLESIQTGGASLFYEGELGQKLVGYMKEAGGIISAADLKNYKVYFRKPFQFEYKNYTIFSSPSPSSGGMGLNFLFNRAMINELAKQPPQSLQAFELIVTSFREYFDFRDVALGDTPDNVLAHTTHLCVIDAEGNIAAMTNTLNEPFGSGVTLPGTGIVLNNEMNDFSLKPNTANRIRPGARPLSSMAPTIVLKNNFPQLVIGSPGGITIPLNLFQVLFYHWEWNLPLADAIRYPKLYYASQSDEILLEEGVSKKTRQLFGPDKKIKNFPSIGNVQALIIHNDRDTETFSDPRGEGRGLTASP
ncbi:MAG: gamma-glutamyltransferase [Deltaproteobacteria bacterium]|nr:gamma-glutamyltransferase [Deltaproteobacteria bacterium]